MFPPRFRQLHPRSRRRQRRGVERSPASFTRIRYKIRTFSLTPVGYGLSAPADRRRQVRPLVAPVPVNELVGARREVNYWAGPCRGSGRVALWRRQERATRMRRRSIEVRSSLLRKYCARRLEEGEDEVVE